MTKRKTVFGAYIFHSHELTICPKNNFLGTLFSEITSKQNRKVHNRKVTVVSFHISPHRYEKKKNGNPHFENAHSQ